MAARAAAANRADVRSVSWLLSWPAAFAHLNLLALIAWAALILLPRRDRVVPVIRWCVVGALCLFYVGALVWALTVGFGEAGPSASFSTIEGVRAIFATDSGVTVGWAHYLAFDLFVGLWIAERADASGVSCWVQAPILVLTSLAGPAGLLVWLLVAAARQTRHGVRGGNGRPLVPPFRSRMNAAPKADRRPYRATAPLERPAPRRSARGPTYCLFRPRSLGAHRVPCR